MKQIKLLLISVYTWCSVQLVICSDIVHLPPVYNAGGTTPSSIGTKPYILLPISASTSTTLKPPLQIKKPRPKPGGPLKVTKSPGQLQVTKAPAPQLLQGPSKPLHQHNPSRRPPILQGPGRPHHLGTSKPSHLSGLSGRPHLQGPSGLKRPPAFTQEPHKNNHFKKNPSSAFHNIPEQSISNFINKLNNEIENKHVFSKQGSVPQKLPKFKFEPSSGRSKIRKDNALDDSTKRLRNKFTHAKKPNNRILEATDQQNTDKSNIHARKEISKNQNTNFQTFKMFPQIQQGQDAAGKTQGTSSHFSTA